jgi:carnitine 3-dehydrogenase
VTGPAGAPASVAVVGCGVIGAGWAARYLVNGVDVIAADPAPDAARAAGDVVSNALLAREQLGLPVVELGELRLVDAVADAVRDVEVVHEAVPERLELKLSVLDAIEDAAPAGALIASSTSGFRPSVLQAALRHPERLVVAHPFNPVYLLPLVEIVAGQRTDPASVERISQVVGSVGMRPLVVRAEIDAFIADRLLEAVWREALWLVRDGIATTEDVDDAIRFGFGLRWAQMGLFETYRIAGGEAGMRHFIGQFGEALAWPWSRLTDVPELSQELIDTIAAQSDEQAAGRSVRELERIRDANLAAILLALEGRDWAAGSTLAAERRRAGSGRAGPQSASGSASASA